ncbi:MAG TPA: chorismate synthase [Bacteroidota bacterium]|nr:chorismate synthase [Bacteroidota bacterium]
MIRYFTSGESHGQGLVGIVEGVPAGLEISAAYINEQLRRRQQGYGRGGRMKIETDTVEILSGVRFGKTIGSPIALLVRNRDWANWTEKMSVEPIDADVEKITVPRPGHADMSGKFKYGFDDIRNVIDRASARETAMRVACCTIARRMLDTFGIHIGSHVLSIGGAGLKHRKNIDVRIGTLIRSVNGAYRIAEEADRSEVRMLDATTEGRAIAAIKACKKKGDTLGGIFEVLVTGVPMGLGTYVQFDRKLDAQLAEAVMSIQAVKGVEIGDAFENARRVGSEVHDEIMLSRKKEILRPTNGAGGMEGGMSNGEPIVLRGAMKPISTLAHPLRSVDLKTNKAVVSRYERSDVCAVPACAVIAEAVIAPVLANAMLEKFGGDSIGEVAKRFRSGKKIQ